MKVALAVCVALLAAVLVLADNEMAPPSLGAGTRLTNSTAATPRQFPFLAYIEGFGADGSLWNKCAGSLITRSAVLTSVPYCIGHTTASKWTVRLGSINRTGEDPNAWTIESTWAMKHPKYNSKTLDNNIAIIHLPRLAPLNEFIQPVLLPSSPEFSSYIGCEGIVAGWGSTHPDSESSDVLRWAKLLVIPNEYCKMYGVPHWAYTERQMCAGSSSSIVRQNDLGAPMVFNIRGRNIQIGITSYLTCGEYNASCPVIYTRVTSFLDWIKLNTESD